MAEQPANLVGIESLEDLVIRLNILFEDVYGRLFSRLQHNDSISDIDVTGMTGDTLIVANKVNDILATLRTSKLIKES